MGGLTPGDVVEYKGKRYLYQGMNPHGGPCMADEPDPMFISANPIEANTVYYIRAYIGDGSIPPLPKIFREGTAPAQAGSTGTYIAFLNPKQGEMKHVDHINAQDWNRMIAEVQIELKRRQT